VVWSLINHFKASNIIYVHILRNVAAYALANVTTRMSPLKNGFSTEIIYKPYVPHNITNLDVFNDDQ